jgi:hypothetical protein
MVAVIVGMMKLGIKKVFARITVNNTSIFLKLGQKLKNNIFKKCLFYFSSIFIWLAIKKDPLIDKNSEMAYFKQ